ncbi:MAG: proteasome alpha subunit [Thermoproteota archaeon]|nr:proteasome alpha subunit [Thermoproteota archaeon]
MAFPGTGAYDRAITIFSPDGRLFQVEYALEVVKRGSTVLGIACHEGVVLAAEEKPASKLQDPNFLWKIFQVDNHIGAAISGLSSDARVLIDHARIQAQSNKLTYDEPIDIEVIAKQIGDVEQQYTQNGGVRPFGVSIIFGGVDKSGARILLTDPSGSCWAYKATAIGIGGETVREVLETKYSDDMNLDQTITLACECLSKVIEEKLEAKKMKAVVIPTSTKKFKRLTEVEVEKYIAKMS